MKYATGDLIKNVKQGIILQQVNAQNVMGSGFAKAVYEKWPIVKSEFHRWSCTFHRDLDRLGQVQTIEVEPGLFVVNIVGQRYYGNDGKTRYTSYDALGVGLEQTSKWMDSRLDLWLTSHQVHHPAIGSGLGGAHWPVVEQLIEKHIGSGTTLWTLE